MFGFLTSCSLIMSSWMDYYGEKNVAPILFNFTQINQYSTSEKRAYISQVTFITVAQTTGEGGAIAITSVTNLLVEYSNFINCHAHGNCGAIKFENSNGQCFLDMVCSINCYSETGNHFSSILTKSSQECTNSLDNSGISGLYSTVSEATNIGLTNMQLVRVKNCNISKNNCYKRSTLDFYAARIVVEYTSILDNVAANYEALAFQGPKPNSYEMKSCNVMGNQAPNSIMIIWEGNLELRDSTVINNPSKPFSFWSGTVHITNCTIDNTQDGSGVSIDSNKIPATTFINKLSNGCFANNELNPPKPIDFTCTCHSYKPLKKCRFNNKKRIVRILEMF